MGETKDPQTLPDIGMTALEWPGYDIDFLNMRRSSTGGWGRGGGGGERVFFIVL